MVITEKCGKYDLGQLVHAASGVIDLIEPKLADHHRRTAYVALGVSKLMGWSDHRAANLALAALLHDVGAFKLSERISLLKFEEADGGVHSVLGARMLEDVPALAPLAPIVLGHHARWDEGGLGVAPQECFVLQLADRVAVTLPPGAPDFDRIATATKRIKAQRGKKFAPDVVDAFLELAASESFWYDLCFRMEDRGLTTLTGNGQTRYLDDAELLGVAKFFCAVVDYRSRFTATHSCGVAAVSGALASALGWGQKSALEMETAGYLHDIGKMAVPVEIIEKPGKLDPYEWFVMKRHPYHTKLILDKVKGLERISHAGAYHHEHEGSRSYPFHLTREEIPREARLLAVADVFTAVTEDRPYRTGMSYGQVEEVMGEMVGSGALAAQYAKPLMEDFDNFNRLRADAQGAAVESYRRVVGAQPTA